MCFWLLTVQHQSVILVLERDVYKRQALHIVKDDPLFRYIREGEYVYYVHSYYGKNCTESTLAAVSYTHLDVYKRQSST